MVLPRLVAVGALGICAISCAGKSSSAPTTPATSLGARPSGVAGNQSQTPAPVESNPVGDIPDNVAYVSYTNVEGGYSFSHPEGWTSVTRGSAVTFTDKLNGISVRSTTASAAPTLSTATRELTSLAQSQPAFAVGSTKLAHLPAGNGVLIIFRRNSAPDPVTGKIFRDEVNRYEIYAKGRLITLDLYGAVGSDNVDPFAKISQSLRIR